MRNKYSHCSNLSFLITSSNVLIMSKNYISGEDLITYFTHIIFTFEYSQGYVTAH